MCYGGHQVTTPQTGGEEYGGEGSPTVHGECQNLGNLGKVGKLVRTLGLSPSFRPSTVLVLPPEHSGRRSFPYCSIPAPPDMNHGDTVRDRGTK